LIWARGGGPMPKGRPIPDPPIFSNGDLGIGAAGGHPAEPSLPFPDPESE
jgi:hypothetical protein